MFSDGFGLRQPQPWAASLKNAGQIAFLCGTGPLAGRADDPALAMA
jgi:hypothetical protein